MDSEGSFVSKSLVLKIKYGGLGDNLLYSPIPRCAKQRWGYDQVWISRYSEYRNPETKHLVWELNPFIDGFTDLDAPYPNFTTTREGFNILDEIMAFYGLPDDGVRFREPELYYQPNIIPSLRDAVILDPNCINKTGIPSMDMVQRYLHSLKMEVRVTHQMVGIYGEVPTYGRAEIVARNLKHFCDIIASCRTFICFTTGSATLAAALHKEAAVLYIEGIKPMFHHSRLHTYVNIGGY